MTNSLPLAFGAINGGLVMAQEHELRAATDFRQALSLCIRLSRVRRTQNDLAALAGINASQLSKIVNGTFHLPTDKIPVIENLCGNTAITQWLALQHGASLKFETPEEKIARLEKQIKEMAA